MRHTLASLLLAAVAAVLAGARSFTAIGEWAADAPPRVLAAQAIQVTRRRRPLNATAKWSTQTSYAVTSLATHQATPAQLAGWIRGQWRIEALHHIRDLTYGEDVSQIRTGHGPQVMASLRNLGIAILKPDGYPSIAAACRYHARDATRPGHSRTHPA